MKLEFIEGLVKMFPEVGERGTVSRQDLVKYMEANNITKWPTWLTRPENRAGRGMYIVNNVVRMPSVKPMVEVKQKSVDLPDTKPMIPSKDSDFVPFGVFKDIDVVIKSRLFYPVYIYGPTGNGKSTAVEQSCARNGVPMIRVNLNSMTDEEQLIGSKTLVDGNIQIIEGPVLIAMRAGIPILLDELDAGSANTLLCLQPVLEGKPYYFKLKNEVVVPAPGFNVFATGNTKGKGSEDGKYIGTNILNEAFLERFAVTMCQEYPTASVELKIVKNVMATYNANDEEFANSLVKWADAIRRTYQDGGIDETITTRRLIHIVRAYSIFKNKEKAIELCTNRFDDVTRQAFISLFEKIADMPEPEPNVIDSASTQPQQPIETA